KPTQKFPPASASRQHLPLMKNCEPSQVRERRKLMSDHDEILDRVRSAVAETLSIELDEPKLNQRFLADVGGESVDWRDLLFRVERDWHVRLPGLENFEGVAADAEGRFT